MEQNALVLLILLNSINNLSTAFREIFTIVYYMDEKSKNTFLERNLFWILPLILSASARGVFGFYFIESPFKNYYLIKGLDMYTIYNQFHDVVPSFYYLFLRGLSVISSPNSFIENLIIVQLLLGIIATMLIVYSAYKLSGNKFTACLSGIIYGLYAPGIIYEGFLLKESFYLFAVVLIIALCFWNSAHKYFRICAFLLGVVLFIPAYTRGVGLLFSLLIMLWYFFTLAYYANGRFLNVLTRLKFLISRSMIFILGILVVQAAVYYSCSKKLPAVTSAFSNFSYFYNVGQKTSLTSVNSPVEKNVSPKMVKSQNIEGGSQSNKSDLNIRYIRNYFRNFLFTLRAYEMPNNINYYFLRDTLLPLRLFIGPVLLFPLALTGILLLLLSFKRNKGIEILIVSAIPVFAGCIIFAPIARYRIVLLPFFAIAGAFAIVSFVSFVSDRKYLKGALLLGLIFLISILEYFSLDKNFYRASDYVCYGQAMRFSDSKNPEVLACFEKAYSMRPDLGFTRRNLIIECLRTGRFKVAKALMRSEYENNPQDFATAIKYVAALLGNRDYSEAYTILNGIKKPDDINKLREYYFNWGEYYFLKEEYFYAGREYRKLQNIINSDNKIMSNYIAFRLKAIETKLGTNSADL